MRPIDNPGRPAAHGLDAQPDGRAGTDLTIGAPRNVQSCAQNPSLAHGWQLRRAFVRARRALLNFRLREVSKAVVEMRGLLSAADRALGARYEAAVTELRACLLVAEDDLPRARELLLSSMRSAIEGTLAATLLRYVDWMSGARMELPERMSDQDPRALSRSRVLERILGLCVNAALEFEHLRPTVAAHLANEALQLATERYGGASPVGCLPAVLLAQIAYEQGRFAEADGLIRPRAAIIRATGVLECILRAGIVLARVAVHHGRSQEALASLRDVETIGRTRGWPRLVSAARAEHSRILNGNSPTNTLAGYAHQRTPETDSVAAAGLSDIDVLPRYSSMQLVLARVTSASSNLSVEERGRILISCLRIGATRGLYRLFVDAGPPIHRLLEKLHQDPRQLEEHSLDLRLYIGLLLRAVVPTATQSRHAASWTHQALSRRETAILRMIAQGMSNKQIAQSLGIAPETVKSHAKSIFLKLGTRTRAQAVARAASHLSSGDHFTAVDSPRRQSSRSEPLSISL
jgi:ATP/maltotriose-dependent transcriptional regulator MalT